MEIGHEIKFIDYLDILQPERKLSSKDHQRCIDAFKEMSRIIKEHSIKIVTAESPYELSIRSRRCTG